MTILFFQKSMNVTPILARIRELARISQVDTFAVVSQDSSEQIVNLILMSAPKILVVSMALALIKSILTNVCVKLDIMVLIVTFKHQLAQQMIQITTCLTTVVFFLKKVTKLMKMPNKIVSLSLVGMENYLSPKPGQKIKWPTRLQSLFKPIGG